MQSATISAPAFSKRAVRRAIGLALVAALLLTLPLAPRSDAQDNAPSLPSESEQQQAAQDLIDQLDAADGPLDPSTLSLDPALGPAPWVSYVPGRDQSTIDAWNQLSERLTSPKDQAPAPAARFALPGSQLVVEDVEGITESGQNDSPPTGQLVSGFGTGPGESGFARILGALGSPPPPPPPPPEPECPSVEDDGAIDIANATPLAIPQVTRALCGGFVGDGPFGETTGDVDFYRYNNVPAGTLISIDAGSFDPNAVFSVTTAIYDAAGNLLGSLDDSDSTGESVLSVVAPVDGEYFGAVAGVGTLPADPFDSASGTGISYVGDYLIMIGTAPAPPPPCVAVEPDSTILDANVLPFGPGEVSPCTGLIGDGTFGDSTGDFDFFALTVDIPSDIIVDVLADPGQPLTPTTIALFDSDGVLLQTIDDDGANVPNFIRYFAEAPGVYYAMVSSPGVLPADPFDASSGTVAGPPVSYQAFILSLPSGPPLPPPGDPDGPQPVPTPTPAPPGGHTHCDLDSRACPTRGG